MRYRISNIGQPKRRMEIFSDKAWKDTFFIGVKKLQMALGVHSKDILENRILLLRPKRVPESP